MVSKSDTFRKAKEALSDNSSAMQHSIQLAKATLHIKFAEIANGRPTSSVNKSPVLHAGEPVFTRDVA